jgi:hypothetical protein
MILCYMDVCVCSFICCECMCVVHLQESVFDFRLKVFEASHQEGVTERCGF